MRMSLLFSILFFISCTPASQEEFAPVGSEFQSEMLDLVNAQRAEGCTCGNKYFPPVGPLSWNNQLEQAASRHAADMNSNNFFDHKGSDGTKIADRVSESGYAWRAVGENIAFGYNNMSEAVVAWIESPSHCELLMSEDFLQMGAGKSGTYWVQTFASPL